ncbi:hypothetical protein NDU88_004994 [Pleurodeles waltl]|uniref:Uncharacterized protein n=1 Tax=Pleurodeles waltl TaxID=8319 RepID=A0AAV7NU26_PLEWA|nr:hypothetical protein NDU88_004994 [Pleurodeles waltl]
MFGLPFALRFAIMDAGAFQKYKNQTEGSLPSYLEIKEGGTAWAQSGLTGPPLARAPTQRDVGKRYEH